jgi:GH24 family phage-related lysozyme (muramidase)
MATASDERLRKGMTGERVRRLQELLSRNKEPTPATGKFDDATDHHLRRFQRRHGLVADGIAGPRTMAALERGHRPKPRPHRKVAVLQKLDVRELAEAWGHHPHTAKSKPAKSMWMSQAGKEFLHRHEAWKGVSNHLHWPKGASGVTLGPGYDMRERSRPQVKADLVAIGVDPDVAEQASAGAGLRGHAAEMFAKDNKTLIDLTRQQEIALMDLVLPQYEAAVRRNIKVDLVQHEFDALVSWTYNCGPGRLPQIAERINHGEVVEALENMHDYGLKKNPALTGRRNHEVSFYLTGSQEPPHPEKASPETDKLTLKLP